MSETVAAFTEMSCGGWNVKGLFQNSLHYYQSDSPLHHRDDPPLLYAFVPSANYRQRDFAWKFSSNLLNFPRSLEMCEGAPQLSIRPFWSTIAPSLTRKMYSSSWSSVSPKALRASSRPLRCFCLQVVSKLLNFVLNSVKIIGSFCCVTCTANEWKNSDSPFKTKVGSRPSLKISPAFLDIVIVVSQRITYLVARSQSGF